MAPAWEACDREDSATVQHKTMEIRGSDTGAWVRETIDSPNGPQVRYINIQKMTPTEEALDWRIYDFDEKQRLTRVIAAQSGNYVDDQGWILQGAVNTALPLLENLTQTPIMDRVMVSSPTRMMFRSAIDPSIFGVMMLKPENMSMRSLYRYVNHLEQSRQESDRYEIALWNKAFYPIAILVMIALAMPFAYMNRRSGGVSIKIFAGVMIGLAFYTINNLFSYIGMLNTWPPLVVAMVPTACMLVLAMIGMWVVERR